MVCGRTEAMTFQLRAAKARARLRPIPRFAPAMTGNQDMFSNNVARAPYLLQAPYAALLGEYYGNPFC